MTMAWRVECSVWATLHAKKHPISIFKCPPRVVTTRHLQVKGNGDQGGVGSLDPPGVPAPACGGKMRAKFATGWCGVVVIGE